MAEKMTEMEVLQAERFASGTTVTKNDEFEKNGYLFLKDLWDSEDLYYPVP